MDVAGMERAVINQTLADQGYGLGRRIDTGMTSADTQILVHQGQCAR